MPTHPFCKWACAIIVVATGVVANAASWNDTGTGASAGEWFNPFSWTPTIVPDLTINADINNGGEALADAATAPADVQANLLEVGTNSFTGTLTSLGVNVVTAGALNVGQAFNSFLIPIPSTEGSGTVTVSDAALVDIGGSLNIGKTHTSDFTTAMGNGAVVFERVDSVVLGSSVDVGEAVANTGVANGRGSLRISDATSLFIDNDLDVGEAFADGDPDTSATSQGSANFERVAVITIDGDLEIGLSTARESGGLSTATVLPSSVTITEGGNMSVRRKTRIGHATTTNTSEASAQATLTVELTGSLEFQDDIEIGLSSTQITSQANAIGSATLSGGTDLTVDGEITVGHAVAGIQSESTGTGTFIVQQFDSLLITDDMTIGRVDSTLFSFQTAGVAQATGNFWISDIQQATVQGEVQVGFGNNDKLGELSTAKGSIRIKNVGLAEMGTELRVGYVRPNTFSVIAQGKVDIENSHVVAPVIEIGVGFNRQSQARGEVSLTDSSLVAGTITVGRDGDTTGIAAILPHEGSLTLHNSTLETDFLTVADRVSPGGVSGHVQLLRSLVTVNDTMLLYEGSGLAIGIEGTQRGDQYGAIDAGTAQLGGLLHAVPLNFVPSYWDEFEVITAATRVGEFDEFAGLLVNQNLTLVPVYDHNGSIGLTLVAALPGDANLDGTVNGLDLLAWQANLFTGDKWWQGDYNFDGTVNGLDLLIWQDHLFESVPSPASPVTQGDFTVPEPGSLWLLGVSVVLAGQRNRRVAAV